jgi:polar amino acid transport system substrate-binding protein
MAHGHRHTRSVDCRAAVWLAGCCILLSLFCLLPTPVRAADPAEAGVPTAGSSILLLSEENPPFNFTDPLTGRFGGPATELVRLMAERAGIGWRIDVNPWARSWHRVQTEADTCIFLINQTEERRPLLAWIGPFLESNWVLYGLATEQRALSGLEEVGALRIGVPANSAVEKFLKGQNGLTVVSAQRQNLAAMLKAGRIDLVALGSLNADELALKAGVEIRKVLTLRRSTLEVGCNLNTSPATLDRLRQAFETLQQDGTVRRLMPGPQSLTMQVSQQLPG